MFSYQGQRTDGCSAMNTGKLGGIVCVVSGTNKAEGPDVGGSCGPIIYQDDLPGREESRTRHRLPLSWYDLKKTIEL